MLETLMISNELVIKYKVVDLEIHKFGLVNFSIRDAHVEMLGFLSIIRDDVLEIFLNFYHGTRMRYLDLSTSFMNFRLRFHLIEFKNYLLASSWSCLDVKMCEIFGLFLDTASTNTY